MLTSCRLLGGFPKFRAGLRQPAADTNRRDLCRKTPYVKLDRDAAKCRRPGSGLKTRGGQFGHEAANRLLLVHPDDRIIIPAHPDVGYVGRSVRQNLMVGGRHMCMGPCDERNPAIDKVREGLLFARCLGVEIDDKGIATRAQWAGRYFPRGYREGIVQGIHEDASHEVHNKDAGARSRVNNMGAAAGCAARVVPGPDHPWFAGDEVKRLALVEGMIAECHAICPRREQIRADRLRDPKASSRILPIDNDTVDLPCGAQPGYVFQEHGTTGPAHDVADEEKTHSIVPGNRSILVPLARNRGFGRAYRLESWEIPGQRRLRPRRKSA